MPKIMCGIHFIFDKRKKLDSKIISKMSSYTRYRGPDETKEKIILSESCSYHLAANRLKITDQSDAASQPFVEDNYGLLFNGEIYNYYELKNDLINKKVNFNSHSDTEVLFHWLKEYGTERIDKLEGMFAFIFIDFQHEEFFICIDRFGIKPIYYYEDSQYFIASSEIKAIIGTDLVNKKLNSSQIHHYLLYKYAKPPGTFFQDIFALTPGNLLDYKNQKWENTYFPNQVINVNEATPDSHMVEDLLSQSLLQQLNANVPTGLLLSGGVDSTLLLALAQKEGYTLPTFSIINTKDDIAFGTEDFHYAKLAASTYSSNHTELLADISLLDQFPEFIAKVDQPIGDSSYLMTYSICQKASSSMKILLSGAGADEVFAGYNRHWAYYKYLKHKKLIDLFVPSMKPLISFLPAGFPHAFRKKFKLIKKFANSYDYSSYNTFQNFISFTELGLTHKHQNQSEKDPFSFELALEHDQNNYLVHDVLALSDRASMLNSIEMRVPYLNEQLLNYLNSFPAKTRIQGGKKWILKEILERNGGKKFTKRAKEGFGLPLSSWLHDKRANHLWQIFESGNSELFEYFDQKKFDKIVSQQKSNLQDHGSLIWSFMVLAHWLKHNF